MQTRKAIALGGIMLLTLAVAACSSQPAASLAPTSSPDVDEARATEIADGALRALNTGDYAGWSKDWDDAMKGAVTDDAFQAFRTTVLTNLGSYVSIKRAELSSVMPGTYRWTFTVAFEKGEGTIGFAFRQGIPLVAGLHTS